MRVVTHCGAEVVIPRKGGMLSRLCRFVPDG